MNSDLETPVAQRLLRSTIPARLAFVGANGYPHVTPIWFVWKDGSIVMAARSESFKVRAIEANRRIALTIDSEIPPYESLRVRGTAEIDLVDGIAAEYVACAHRYYGVKRGQRWIDWMAGRTKQMALISLTPQWVQVLDFRQHFAPLFDD
jgi:nitroimidazol reductase NimA-like FMN-containing flavoprotein (pyridoxamine 5'-phosphate oxidase superfamily)